MSDWLGPPQGDKIYEEVLKMVETLKKAKYSPFELHLSDETLQDMGYDPNDYPELEGYPGWRKVKAS